MKWYSLRMKKMNRINGKRKSPPAEPRLGRTRKISLAEYHSLALGFFRPHSWISNPPFESLWKGTWCISTEQLRLDALLKPGWNPLMMDTASLKFYRQISCIRRTFAKGTERSDSLSLSSPGGHGKFHLNGDRHHLVRRLGSPETLAPRLSEESHVFTVKVPATHDRYLMVQMVIP